MKLNKINSLLIFLVMASVSFVANADKGSQYKQNKNSRSGQMGQQGTQPRSPAQTRSQRLMEKSEFKSTQVVKQVQEKLKQRGYDAGPVDGVIGPKTTSALQEFQQDKNISTTGRINQDTLAELGIDPQKARQQEEEAFAE